jgi:hypothetical protein
MNWIFSEACKGWVIGAENLDSLSKAASPEEKYSRLGMLWDITGNIKGNTSY